MARKRKGLAVRPHGGTMVAMTNQRMQEKPKHGRKNRGLTGRSRHVRKIGSGRM